MKTAILAAAIALSQTGCGSDDEEPKQPPVKCSSDMKLSGGATVDGFEEFDCPEGLSYSRTTQFIQVESQLPGDQPGIISLRIFGLEEATAPGTTLPAGVALDLGVPPTEHWEATFDTATGCSATIDEQHQQPTAGITAVTASVSCTEQLTSTTVGTPPVIIERMRIRSEYGP